MFKSKLAYVSPITPANTTSQLLGSKVNIQTPDGEYEGIVGRVWGNLEKISLDHVVAVGNRTKFFGLQYFYKNDILSLTIVEDACPQKSKTSKKSRPKEKTVHLAPLPFGKMEQKETSDYSDEDDEFTMEKNSVSVPDSADYSKTGNITWDEGANGQASIDCLPKFKSSWPSKYITLDEINSKFHESINEIKKCSELGVGIEGNVNGRFGEIVILSIATATNVYLFDIFSLEGLAFDNGLREILESSTITKVFHDCRLPSDALFHLYQVDLGNNVFDTQVGDLVIHMKANHNMLPEYVKSLENCLWNHLQLDGKYLPAIENKLNELQKVTQWKVRPLLPTYRSRAIHSVMFLQQLKRFILQKLLADLTFGIEIYLSTMKNASKEESALLLGSVHSLPPAMSSITSQEMKFLNHIRIDNHNDSEDDLWFSTPKVPSQLRPSECQGPVVAKRSDHERVNGSKERKHRDSTVNERSSDSQLRKKLDSLHLDDKEETQNDLEKSYKLILDREKTSTNAQWPSRTPSAVKLKMIPAGTIIR